MGMIPDGQRSEGGTLFGDKEPPESLGLKKQQPLGYVAGSSACLDHPCLDHCPVIPTLWKSVCSQFVGNGRKPMASSVLVLIRSMFALTLTGSPLFLAPEWQDLLLGSSLRIFAEVPALEVLPCSHPAFGEFCQARGGHCPRHRINPAYLFLFILLKTRNICALQSSPTGALPAPP